MPDLDFLLTIGALALVAYGCRVGGYLMMRFVRATPRVQAALAAVPLAAMIGIVTPTMMSGRIPEAAGLVMVAIVMRLTGSELAAAVAGTAVVALGRHWGF